MSTNLLEKMMFPLTAQVSVEEADTLWRYCYMIAEKEAQLAGADEITMPVVRQEVTEARAEGMRYAAEREALAMDEYVQLLAKEKSTKAYLKILTERMAELEKFLTAAITVVGVDTYNIKHPSGTAFITRSPYTNLADKEAFVKTVIPKTQQWDRLPASYAQVVTDICAEIAGYFPQKVNKAPLETLLTTCKDGDVPAFLQEAGLVIGERTSLAFRGK